MTGRLTDKQLELVREDLTDRDWQVIATLARVRVATSPQLVALHFADVDRRRALHRLRRLTERRVISRSPRIVGGVRAGSRGHVYALDVAGQRLADLNRVRRLRPPRTVGAAFVGHALAVTDAYVQLVLADRGESVRLLRFVAEPGAWRSYIGPGGARVWIKPDAYAVVGVGGFEDHWFLEIDCGTESAATLARKLTAYVQYWRSGAEDARAGVFPRVLWLVRDQPRQGLLAAVIGRQQTEVQALFDVTTADQLVGRLAAGGEA